MEYQNVKTDDPTIEVLNQVATVEESDNTSEPEITFASSENQKSDSLSTKTTNFKLTIEASEVNQKYLRKSYAQATPDTKKSSGIKKLFEKANELKHDQDPFGELRVMKDEVLAFNMAGKKNGQIK